MYSVNTRECRQKCSPEMEESNASQAWKSSVHPHVCKKNVYFKLHLDLLCCLLQHQVKSHEKQTKASIINKLPPCQIFTLNCSSISGDQQPSVWPYTLNVCFSSPAPLRFYRLKYSTIHFTLVWRQLAVFSMASKIITLDVSFTTDLFMAAK